MFDILGSLLLVCVTIHTIIVVHECGHYIVARWLGIRVQTFAIGLGKSLFQHTDKHQITWQLGAVPLGGYVVLLDSRSAEYSAHDLPYALDARPLWQKLCVYLAGPAMNIIVAILLYTALYINGLEYIKPYIGNIIPESIAARAGMQGQQTITHIGNIPVENWQDTTFEIISYLGSEAILPITTHNQHTYQLDTSNWEINPLRLQPLVSIGIDPYIPFAPPIVSKVIADSPASGKIQVNDRILAINTTTINSRDNWIDALHGLQNQDITVRILRNGHPLLITIHSSWQFTRDWQLQAYTGIIVPLSPWPAQHVLLVKHPPLRALHKALQTTFRLINFNGVLLSKIITREIPITALSGPIGFVKVAMNTLNQPFSIYLELCAIFNILIAFANLLPFPGLDGGHVVFKVCEAIRGKALSFEFQRLITRFSIIFLVVITIHATINDLIRIAN